MSTQETGGGPPGTGTVSGGGPEAACNVDGATGNASSSVGCSVVRTTNGVYTITLTIPRSAANSVILATPQFVLAGGTTIDAEYSVSPKILVQTASVTTGLLTDCSFSFALFVV